MTTRLRTVEALRQIAEIHDQMVKGEIYRGYRPLPAALTGVMGLAAAGAQPFVVMPGDLAGMIRFWSAVAGVNLAIHAGAAAWRLARGRSIERRLTLRVEGQFAPAVAAGALITAVMLAADGAALAFLPGIWGLLFSVGLFATRPYLPQGIGRVALFYLFGGGVLLLLHDAGVTRLGWALGIIFGAGQLWTGAVLHCDEAGDA